MSNYDVADIVAVLRARMLDASKASEFDLTIDDETGAIDLATDEWSLQIDGGDEQAIAFISVDNEPDDDRGMARVLDSQFRAAELAALAAADNELDGFLTAALDRADDPLSTRLAARLRG